MARRPNAGTAVADPETEVEGTPETVNPPKAEETETKSDKPEVDLTEFQNAVLTAVGQRDDATGVIAIAHVEPVLAAYRALPGGVKAKNKAKNLLNEGVKEGMAELNIQKARAYMQLADTLTAPGAKKEKAERVPADPTAAAVLLDAAFQLGRHLISANVTEGVAEDWRTQADDLATSNMEAAEQYLAWFKSDAEDKGDEPEVQDAVKMAVKLYRGRAAKLAKGSKGGTRAPFDGPRRSIAKHIEEAFADVPSGTFLTVAQIRQHRSTEYGDDSPSAGAINARLFPSNGKCSLDGITPDTNEKSNRGARKN